MTKKTQQVDPYIWLEDLSSEKSLGWVNAHNQSTFDELQKNSNYERIRTDALKIMAATDKIPMISFQKNFVYNFWTDAKNPRGLYRRTTYADYKTKNPHWEILLDIDKLGKDEGKSWVFRGCSIYELNPSVCLLHLSDGGKDAHEIREFDLQSKTFVKDGFFVPLAKSSVAWLDLDTLLVSTDFGPGSMSESGYPREVRKFNRGQNVSEASKVFEAPLHAMRAYSMSDCQAESCEVFIVEDKDFYHKNYFWYKNNELIKIEIPETADLHGFFKNKFYYSLTHDWKSFKRGSLLRAEFGKWDESIEIYKQNETSSFQSIFFSKNDVYITVLENVLRKVYKFGPSSELIPFPAPGIGNSGVTAVNIYQDQALFNFESHIIPPTLYEWNSKLKKIKSMPARFNDKNLIVEQLQATSFDGTKIPYFIIRNKTKIGPGPTLMTAYGGFQIPLSPYYEGVMGKVWLNQGGQYVVANIRGGGEFGPRWHEAALKHNRQVAYHDLYAVTEDLFKKGFTMPEQLGLMGGSNGGLLAGVAMTQRPELYKAIVILVPLLDMLRYHKLHAGHSWIGEYGNPDIPSERSYIEKYSPYQNLKTGIKYPNVFLLTSTFDDRVHPGHARKFSAKLDELQIPFYYYENTEGGHAGAADMNQRAKFIALYYSFLFEKLMGAPPLP